MFAGLSASGELQAARIKYGTERIPAAALCENDLLPDKKLQRLMRMQRKSLAAPAEKARSPRL